MTDTQTTVTTLDLITFMYQILPGLVTFGGTIGILIAFAGRIKTWINKDSVTKEWLESHLHDKDFGVLTLFQADLDKDLTNLHTYIDKEIAAARQKASDDLLNHKERSNEKDTADKIWLNALQEKVETLQQKVAALRK